MAHSNAGAKPAKPYDGLPLFPHATGRWAKKIRGKLHYFGPWADSDAALAKYLDQRGALHAGRTPRATGDGLTLHGLCNPFCEAKERQADAGDITRRPFVDYHTTCTTVISSLGKNRLVDDIASDDFEALRAALAKRCNPNTLGNEVQRIRTLFKYGYDAGLIDKPMRFGPTFKRPAKRILRAERQRKGERMFEARQIRRLLKAAPQPLRAMILLGINCGFGNHDVGTLPIANDSMIGVLRVREVFVNRDPHASPEITTVRVAYRFELLTRGSTPEEAEFSPLAIRGELGQLRFPEAAFHHANSPAHPSTVTMNPPRVRAVTPGFDLHTIPFRISALALDIDLTRERVDLTGEILAPTAWHAWWQTVSLAIQYADPPTSNQRTLPLNFRSCSIRSLAATLPDLPLPTDGRLPLIDGNGTIAPALRSWQPVLPGSLRWSGVGNRAGAFFAARAQLITQVASEKPLTSGSVPVQHRFPRPIPIPKNLLHEQEQALAPWVMVRPRRPCDGRPIRRGELHARRRRFYRNEHGTGRAARRICWSFRRRSRRRTTRKVAHRRTHGLGGALDSPQIHQVGTADRWDPRVTLNCESFRVPFEQLPLTGPDHGLRVYKPAAINKPLNDLFRVWLAGRSHGDELLLDLSVRVPDGVFAVKDLKLALRLTNRFTSASDLPLPIRPVTIRFVDPAYSRKLQSRTQQRTHVINRPAANGQNQPGMVTVAIDRERINPTSTLNLAFRFDGFRPVAGETQAQLDSYLNSLRGKVQIYRVREGVSTPGFDQFDLLLGQSSPFRRSQLATVQFPLTFQRGDTILPQPLEPHDTIRVGFEVEHITDSPKLNEFALDLSVVKEPITPAVQRAFGLLLLSATDAVECRRFAWSPTPARIELINPDNLFLPIVRRRGVFRWSDTLRIVNDASFVIQAIMPSGATLIPTAFTPLE